MANSNDQALVAAITAGLRTSFVPSVVRQLADIEGFLDAVWPQLAPSVDTAGFLGSALYMADMALGAVEEVYDEPTLSRESLLAGGLTEADLDQVIAVLDVFHWLQPQLLLLLAALAEAHDAPSVGGQGRPEPREPSEREQAHIDTPVELASPQAGLLPEVPVELQFDAPPDLYRAIAVWPGYFDAVWDELQHLVAYPLFRQRGRALYFYARSSSRFLAVPLQADDAALGEAGMRPDDIARARVIVDRELSAVSTMMMHCTAMRVGLGLREREVVREA
ncbi:MAG: hypothetical protein OXC56_05195 [Chloroflexi bacterium]|nr:hypothetical protein [Chloroflexota bacterium]